jgi:hypothetical protein
MPVDQGGNIHEYLMKKEQPKLPPHLHHMSIIVKSAISTMIISAIAMYRYVLELLFSAAALLPSERTVGCPQYLQVTVDSSNCSLQFGQIFTAIIPSLPI